MSSYLEIAERVIAHVRRPLSAREILKFGYLADIVPKHLYGRTQHKTLQARLAEDIAAKGSRSHFYRTEPGRFFLSHLIDDPEIPIKLKLPFVARPRVRDLSSVNVLVSKRPATEVAKTCKLEATQTAFVPLAEARAYPCMPVFISFCVMIRDDSILLHDIGGYRAGRTQLSGLTSIGFGYPVVENDLGLFSEDRFGVAEASKNGVMRDFGLDDRLFAAHFRFTEARASCQLVSDYPNFGDTIVYLTFVRAPPDYDPTLRKLAINNLRWEHLNVKRNHLDDFDPWSKAFYSSVFDEIR